MMKNSVLGFSLIELMIVVAIVAILAGVAYPSYRNQVMRSNRAEAKNAILQVQVAQEKFYVQSGRYAGDNACAATELTNAPDHATTPGLGVPASTSGGHYAITLCRPTASTYTATATATGAQLNDSECRRFEVTQTGNKTSYNSSNVLTTTACWK